MRMKLYDVEESAKNNVQNYDVEYNTPVMDNTPSGASMKKPTFNKEKLEGFK
jgi:hypothetical protein